MLQPAIGGFVLICFGVAWGLVASGESIFSVISSSNIFVNMET
jgi:hypothetical protein